MYAGTSSVLCTVQYHVQDGTVPCRAVHAIPIRPLALFPGERGLAAKGINKPFYPLYVPVQFCEIFRYTALYEN